MRHTGIAVYVHIVWGTWDRLPVVTETIRRDVYRAIGEQCQAMHAEVIALGGIEDHVHLLLTLPATVSLAELVKQVKGASSHLATHRLTNGQFFKWQGSYGAVSVSPDALPIVSEYIQSQREHHTNHTTEPLWELGATPTPVQ